MLDRPYCEDNEKTLKRMELRSPANFEIYVFTVSPPTLRDWSLITSQWGAVFLEGGYNFKTSPFLVGNFSLVRNVRGVKFYDTATAAQGIWCQWSILDPVVGGKGIIKYLTRYQVWREGLFDMVAQEPGSQSAILKFTQKPL